MQRIKFALFFTLFIVIFSTNSQDMYSQRKGKAPKSKERIEMVKKMKMLEALNLSEDEADKFLAKYTAYEKKIDDKFEAMKVATNDLRQSIDKQLPDIKAKSDKIITLQDELNATITEKQKDMRNALNDVAYAKYILFEHTFFRNLNNALIECRGKGRDKDRR